MLLFPTSESEIDKLLLDLFIQYVVNSSFSMDVTFVNTMHPVWFFLSLAYLSCATNMMLKQFHLT